MMSQDYATTTEPPCRASSDMTNLEGQPAPSFSVTDTRGKVHCLEDYRGRWVMLVMHRHLA